MLKIRLQRVGRKHDPSFRVVLTDSKNGPQSGKFQEVLGTYDARTDKTILKGDEIKAHIAHGAQTSDTVHNLLIANNVIEGKKINVLPKKSPIVAEKTEEEKAAEASAAETPSDDSSSKPAEEAPAQAPTEASATEATPEVAEAPKEEVKEEAKKEVKEEVAA